MSTRFFSVPGATLSLLCKSSGKWGIYINSPHFTKGQLLHEASWLADFLEILVDYEGFFMFDTKEKMEECYEMTPGNSNIFLMTCGPDGQIIAENRDFKKTIEAR